jgi:Tfp pilus assembly major pilin PilA
MPARQKMTPVEVMIVLAILGILASIALPAMKQAQGRARHVQRVARQYSAPRAASDSDGQLNTIEVSELSRNSERGHPEQWFGALIGLLPVVVAVAFIYVFVKRVRQQMTRRRAR